MQQLEKDKWLMLLGCLQTIIIGFLLLKFLESFQILNYLPIRIGILLGCAMTVVTFFLLFVAGGKSINSKFKKLLYRYSFQILVAPLLSIPFMVSLILPDMEWHLVILSYAINLFLNFGIAAIILGFLKKFF